MTIPGYLLRQAITIENPSGTTGGGLPAYGVPVTHKGRLEISRRMVQDAKGRDVITDARAFFKPEVDVQPEARLTCNGASYLAVTTNKAQGATRPSHLEVTLRSG